MDEKTKKTRKKHKHRFDKNPTATYSGGYKVWECKGKGCRAYADNYRSIVEKKAILTKEGE